MFVVVAKLLRKRQICFVRANNYTNVWDCAITDALCKTYVTVERVDGYVERRVVPLHLLRLLRLLSVEHR